MRIIVRQQRRPQPAAPLQSIIQLARRPTQDTLVTGSRSREVLPLRLTSSARTTVDRGWYRVPGNNYGTSASALQSITATAPLSLSHGAYCICQLLAVQHNSHFQRSRQQRSPLSILWSWRLHSAYESPTQYFCRRTTRAFLVYLIYSSHRWNRAGSRGKISGIHPHRRSPSVAVRLSYRIIIALMQNAQKLYAIDWLSKA